MEKNFFLELEILCKFFFHGNVFVEGEIGILKSTFLK